MQGTRGSGVALVFESSARWTSPSVAPRTRTTALFFLDQFGRETHPCKKKLKLPRHSANWPRHSAMARQGPARQPLAPHTQTTALFLILRQFGRETHRTRPCRSFFPGTRPIGRGTRPWPVKAPACPTARCSLFQCLENQRAIGFLLAMASFIQKKLHNSVLCFWSNSAEKRTLQKI